MTRRDFQQLAVALYEARMTAHERRKLAWIIADVCANNNKLFDRQKFYAACGLNKLEAPKEVK